MRIAGIALGVMLLACGGEDVSRLVGARCDVTSDCDHRCLAPEEDFPGGFCTVECSSNADCPDDTVCVEKEGGVCLFSCLDNGDCAFLGAGWTCHEDPLQEDPSQVTRACRGD